MFGNHEYGSAAVDDPRAFDQEDLGASDSERDDSSLWACAPETGDLSETTDGWEPCGTCDGRGMAYYGGSYLTCRSCVGSGTHREPMSPFGAMVFEIGAQMMRRQADAFAEAR